MKIKDITNAIEHFAPLTYQDSYDNSGLIVGNPEAEVIAALFCVDVTDAVIDEAMALGANMVISHHPLIFNPLKQLIGDNRVERLVIKAIKNDLAIYSCHTNLDSTKNGLSVHIANMLSLKNVEVLSKREDGSGYGAVGELRHSMDLSSFLSELQQIFNSKSIRYSAPHTKIISTVAVCSGSGSSMIGAAIGSGADIFVTADLKYNHFFDADNKIILADIGHFESEYCSIEILFDIVTKKIPKFAAYKSKLGVNGVNYHL